MYKKSTKHLKSKTLSLNRQHWLSDVLNYLKELYSDLHINGSINGNAHVSIDFPKWTADGKDAGTGNFRLQFPKAVKYNNSIVYCRRITTKKWTHRFGRLSKIRPNLYELLTETRFCLLIPSESLQLKTVNNYNHKHISYIWNCFVNYMDVRQGWWRRKLKKNNGFWEKMLQENTKNKMDTDSKEHRFIWSNTAK